MLKEATIHFYCLFDESYFSNICTLWYVIMECTKLNWLCKHMKKVRSSQAAILVLNGYRTISLGQLPPRRLPPGKLLWIEWNRVFPIVKLRKLKFWVRHFSSIVTSKWIFEIPLLNKPFISFKNQFISF